MKVLLFALVVLWFSSLSLSQDKAPSHLSYGRLQDLGTPFKGDLREIIKATSKSQEIPFPLAIPKSDAESDLDEVILHTSLENYINRSRSWVRVAVSGKRIQLSGNVSVAPKSADRKDALEELGVIKKTQIAKINDAVGKSFRSSISLGNDMSIGILISDWFPRLFSSEPGAFKTTSKALIDVLQSGDLSLYKVDSDNRTRTTIISNETLSRDGELEFRTGFSFELELSSRRAYLNAVHNIHWRSKGGHWHTVSHFGNAESKLVAKIQGFAEKNDVNFSPKESTLN